MKKAGITLWFLIMQLCVGSRKAAYKKQNSFININYLKNLEEGGTGIRTVFHPIPS